MEVPTIEICDVCAITIRNGTIIRSGDYIVCSDRCLVVLKQKHQQNPFFGVRPARDQIGEN